MEWQPVPATSELMLTWFLNLTLSSRSSLYLTLLCVLLHVLLSWEATGGPMQGKPLSFKICIALTNTFSSKLCCLDQDIQLKAVLSCPRQSAPFVLPAWVQQLDNTA